MRFAIGGVEGGDPIAQRAAAPEPEFAKVKSPTSRGTGVNRRARTGIRKASPILVALSPCSNNPVCTLGLIA